jgi:hypothetical protein
MVGAGFLIDVSYLTLKLAARLARMPLQDLAAAAVARERAKRETEARTQQLDRILGRLQSYRREELERDIADFAHAEAYEEDPLQARRIFPEDTHGVGAAFDRRLGRRSP